MIASRWDIWKFARAGALSRILLWVTLLTGVATVIMSVSWAVGAPVRLVGPDSNKTWLNLLAFFLALLVMSRSDRSVGAYGLAIGEHWGRHALRGFAIGASILGAVTLGAIITDAWRTDTVSIGRWLESFAKAFVALPLSITATITFAGFVAGSTAERWGRLPAVLLAASLFALVSILHPTSSTRGDVISQFTTAFLLMVVVAQMRFLTGDIALGASFLCGIYFIERLVRKSSLLDPPSGNEFAASLFAPERLLTQAPALWIGLALLAVVGAVLLHKRPAASTPERRAVSRRFARSYPFATMGALATLDVWLPQLWRARFRIDPVYLPRLIATLILSTINTALTIPERLLTLLTAPRSSPAAPIFIVGAHRSGTTHLHNLLSLDPRFVAPTTWQVINPQGFRFSGWLLRPIFDVFAPWKRPMDAVAFGMWAPAEEEFAIANMSGLSPDWSLRLPRLAAHYDRFGFPDRMTESEQRRWGALHTRFLAHIVGRSGRRPLLKNPHNTGRLRLLLALYPGASFIHIRRNPADVIRSNAHLARTAHELFQCQNPIEGRRYEERYPALYRAMEERFYDVAQTLPPDRVVEVRYEDLAADPKRTLRRIYDQLGLEWTPEYESRLNVYLERISGYTRHPKAPLTDEEQARLERELGPLIERWRRLDDESASEAPETSSSEIVRSA